MFNRKFSAESLLRHKISKSGWCFIIILIFLINYSILSDYSYSRSKQVGHRNVKNHRSHRNESQPWKKILFWTPYFGSMDSWSKVFRRLIKKNCEEYRCKMLFNKKRLEEADAVVFNANDLQKKAQSLFEAPFNIPDPKKRKPDQVFVFFSFEPPANMDNINLNSFSNYFNWTMTYRRDSDIFIPFGKVVKKTRASGSNWREITAQELQERKKALWMVSHCITQSKRETFVRELQKYMEVDIFGLCGPYKCGDRTTIPNIEDEGANVDPCDKMIGNYSFYLSLENSICTDYVTEKLFRSLYRGAIPVVLGGANYSFFAPKNSYINIKEFDTVEDISKHMLEVSSKPELFNRYFDWRKEYEVELGHPYSPHTCELCKRLHSKEAIEKKQSYDDIKKWYVSQSQCFSFRV